MSKVIRILHNTFQINVQWLKFELDLNLTLSEKVHTTILSIETTLDYS